MELAESTVRRDDRRALRLFIGSGFTSVVFQVLWLRVFTSVLGSTTQSVAAVVTCFMLGLGLGNLLFGKLTGRRLRNPLRLYGHLELTVFIAALIAFWLFLRIDAIYPLIHRALPTHLVKWASFAFALVFVTIPATAMGGSLPVLVAHTITDRKQIRRGLADLYSANALGGAIGAIAAMVLVWAAGYLVAYHIALAISLGIAGMAYWYARDPSAQATCPEATRDAPSAPSTTDEPSSKGTAPVILVGFFMTGFCALCYEVIWFRLLEYFGHGMLALFGAVLALYIMGLSIGSRVAGAMRIPPGGELRVYLGLQVVMAVIVLASGPLVSWAFADRMRGGAVLAGVIVTVTFLSGALFPLAGKLYTRSTVGLGRNIGRLYFANTLGSVLGSLLSGFVFLPWIGTEGTYLLAAMVQVAAVVLLVIRFRQVLRPRLVGAGALAVVAAFAVVMHQQWAPRLYLNVIRAEGLGGDRILFSKESGLQAVLVTEGEEGNRTLFGGPYQSGETDLARRQTQRLQAHIPMLMHPNPQRVLEIGFGVGEIARTVLLYEPQRFDMVEIDPNMISVAEGYLSAINGRPSSHPATRVVVTDGRLYLRTTHEAYDVIMSDTMIPDSEQSFRLYTREHFEQGKAHLSPDGIMLAWVPTNIGDEPSRVLFETFRQVFPHSVVLLPMAYNHQEAFIVGFKGEPRVDFGRLHERFERVAAQDLSLLVWDDLGTLLGSMRADSEGLRVLAHGAPVNRDMNPVLDFMNKEEHGLWMTVVSEHHLPLDALFEVAPAERPLWESTKQRVALSRQADERFVSVWKARDPKRLGDTEARLRALLADYPQHPAARLGLSDLVHTRAAKETDPARAQALLEEALRLNPYHLQANLALARAYIASGRSSDAEACLARARQAAPYSPTVAELAANLVAG